MARPRFRTICQLILSTLSLCVLGDSFEKYLSASSNCADGVKYFGRLHAENPKNVRETIAYAISLNRCGDESTGDALMTNLVQRIQDSDLITARREILRHIEMFPDKDASMYLSPFFEQLGGDASHQKWKANAPRLRDPNLRQFGYLNLGNGYADRGEFELARDTYKECLRIKKVFTCHLNLGLVHQQLGEPDKYHAELLSAIALRPHHPNALCKLITSLLAIEWGERWRYADNALKRAIEREGEGPQAQRCLSASGSIYKHLDLRERLTIAVREADQIALAVKPFPKWKPIFPETNPRLRIGWLYHTPEDPAPLLFHDIWKHQDRQKFEYFMFLDGRDGGAYFENMIMNSGSLIDVTGKSAGQTADEINSKKIDMILDLKGMHSRWCQDIAAHRPSKIAINLIGYLGTTGADFYQFTLTDAVAVPPEASPFYTESLMIVPPTFFPSSHATLMETAVIPKRHFCDVGKVHDVPMPDRGMWGEDAEMFWRSAEEGRCVIGNLNRLTKIDGETFETWVEILRRTPNAELTLVTYGTSDGEAVAKRMRELRMEIGRVKVVSRAGLDLHFGRSAQMDLLLDAFVLNAHTTASDSLFVAVPLVTFPSETWSGRVGASILIGMGAGELVVRSAEEYIQLVSRTCRTRRNINRLRCRLSELREKSSVFDSLTWTRRLERSIVMVWDTLLATQRKMNTVLNSV